MAFPDHDISQLSHKDQNELIRLLAEQEVDGLANVDLYAWQRRFNAATKLYRQCMLMAANQVGKTLTGTYLDGVHATGRYPDDWEGHKFTKAPLMWVLGYSGDKCRDILQRALFGDYSGGEFTGGLIQPEDISGSLSSGVPGLAQVVFVKWKGPDGEKGTSAVHFKSYSQGQHALMGDVVDWFHIDEEPKDHTIWPQVLTRIINGDKNTGGRGILTFTPENGRTELVTKFMDDPGIGQYLQTATWKDAPHLTPEIQEELLSSYPEYQRKMRTEGYPLMGSGLIYEISEEYLKVEPFEIPLHWFVICAIDFGWNHPQAVVQLVWNRDADEFFLINAWKEAKRQPFEAWNRTRAWVEGVPCAWPADGLQTEKGSAKQQKSYYEDEGFEMIGEHAQWPDGGNGVEAGLMELNNLMKSGRLKVFSNLHDFFEELRQYHRKEMEDGKSVIVKIKDDILDAVRYAYMHRHHARRICDIGGEFEQEYYEDRIDDTRDDETGY